MIKLYIPSIRDSSSRLRIESKKGGVHHWGKVVGDSEGYSNFNGRVWRSVKNFHKCQRHMKNPQKWHPKFPNPTAATDLHRSTQILNKL